MRRVRNSFGFAIALSVVSMATSASAQRAPEAAPRTPAVAEVEVEPPDYPPPSARWKVAGVGLAAAGVFYGAALGLSYVYPDDPGMKDLRVPVVGPFIGMVNNGCPEGEPDCSQVWVVLRTVLMALDGVAQAGSLAVALEGVFMPTQEPVLGSPVEAPRAPSAPPAPPTKPAPGAPDKNLFFVPMPMTVGSRGIGLGVTGRF